ncbi:probable G-protein coupled receptor B0563.6 [Mytilus edulis]|uniref:G-protein coupled receptors family 1 profile domain-containing protein n=1 Tax=Mytilus edulis TaxID=6550 RepID=A0A8S3S0Q1_MYTED|nr:unnamed protein product [Mytilus edulis]
MQSTTISMTYTSISENVTANITSDNGTTASSKKVLSLLDQLNQYDEFKAAVVINNYYLYVLCALGIPGSACALITICRMKPLTSSSVYMAMLSLVDAMNLVFKLLYLLLTLYDVRLFDNGCRTMFFIGTFLMHYSNWLLVSMTIERFIAIWFPLQVTKLCTKRRAFINMIVLAIILMALNFQFYWTTVELPHKVYVWQCSFMDEYVHFITKVWYWIDGAAYSIVPFILLLIFNTMIILGIKMASSKQRMLTNKIDKTQNTDKIKHQQQITIMLVSISVVFIILTMPNCAFFIMQDYWDYTKDVHTYAQYFLVYNIVFFLSDLNHAINFYMYFLSGRKFRTMFINMICCCRKKPLRRPYSTTMTQMSSVSMRNGSAFNTTLSSQQDILKNSANGTDHSSNSTVNTIA